MYYPCRENKCADQLRSYCEADLRLCFRLCRLLVFPCGGSINIDYRMVIIHIQIRIKPKVYKIIQMQEKLGSVSYLVEKELGVLLPTHVALFSGMSCLAFSYLSRLVSRLILINYV